MLIESIRIECLCVNIKVFTINRAIYCINSRTSPSFPLSTGKCAAYVSNSTGTTMAGCFTATGRFFIGYQQESTSDSFSITWTW